MRLLPLLKQPSTAFKPWCARLAFPLSSLLLCSSMTWAQPDTPAGVPDDQNGFLQFINKTSPLFKEDDVTATAYYNAIDPTFTHRTLADFRKETGLAACVDAQAIYINNADLGFGRRMTTRVNKDGSVASCVENYGGSGAQFGSVDVPDQVKLDNAKLQRDLVATVCMDYSGTPGAYAPVTGTTTTTTSLLAYNDDISTTNYNSRITRVLQPGNYRMVAATYYTGRAGTFTLQSTGIVNNIAGSWASSGGRSYTSPGNPSYPLRVTTATSVTITLTSAVDTYLYLVKDTTITTAPPNRELLGPKYTKFYVYAHNALQGTDNLVTNANLDGRGARAVPGLCNVCHGGAPKALENGVYPDLGNTNTQWLPWDLDTFVYDTVDPSLSRAAQEPQFKKFNQAVLATYPQPSTVTWTGSVAIPDNDFNGVTIPLTVSGVKGPINQLIVSIDGDATFPGITHPNADDVGISIIAPNGQILDLASGSHGLLPPPYNGGPNFRNMYFSDDAERMWGVFDQAPPSERHGIYLPTLNTGFVSLNKFNGIDPNGTWKLVVTDVLAGNSGTVNQWSIHFNGTPDGAYLPAPVELIRGWYGGTSAANPTPNPTFNNQFIPKGWLLPAVGSGLYPTELYLKVVGPTCRACHAQRGTMRRNEADFASYDKFIGVYGKQVASLVFDKGLMPMARRTYQNHFWSKDGSTSNPPAALLAKFLGVDINTRQPGFPVANAGLNLLRDLPLGFPITLNGKGSVFATGYKWTMSYSPFGTNQNVSAAVLTGDTTATPTFTPDVEGDYFLSLVVNNAKGSSSASISRVRAVADAPPSPLSFATQVSTSLGARGCRGCHYNNLGPTFLDQNHDIDKNLFYRRMVERIDFNDVANSLYVRKMNGDVPHAGFWSGVDPLIIRWIYDGAPNN
ncbi:MAG: proprotein convertase P-domain-containing protein [Gammaproteobacteria bacterium]|nr:proprotein convertase P-domain-containing protein [Gammaproteobacteria bacterium]